MKGMTAKTQSVPNSLGWPILSIRINIVSIFYPVQRWSSLYWISLLLHAGWFYILNPLYVMRMVHGLKNIWLIPESSVKFEPNANMHVFLYLDVNNQKLLLLITNRSKTELEVTGWCSTGLTSLSFKLIHITNRQL